MILMTSRLSFHGEHAYYFVFSFTEIKLVRTLEEMFYDRLVTTVKALQLLRCRNSFSMTSDDTGRRSWMSALRNSCWLLLLFPQ